MQFRPYDPERDNEAIHRIWREVGWIEAGKEEPLDHAILAARTMVAELEGSAECAVLSARGDLQYLDERLSFAGLTGVATSRVARRQGLARRLAALSVALDAADGVQVHGLGMFEQGFYNPLGYGTGPYERWVKFDPAHLLVSAHARVPRRLGPDDWEAIHAARLRRLRVHGSVNLYHPGATRGELIETDNGFGLGYGDGPGGALSHYLWCGAKDLGHGPYTVYWLAYETREQFLELMSLLKGLSDQVHLVQFEEPAGIQLQDLVAQPRKDERVSRASRFEAGVSAHAYWQMRICDLPACLAKTHLAGQPVRFHLRLEDPIAEQLGPEAPWRGIGGDYVVELGPQSGAEPGCDPSLPTLEATVNALTRLWLGARPAWGLAFTDSLRGPTSLVDGLDRLVRVPVPHMDWDF